MCSSQPTKQLIFINKFKLLLLSLLEQTAALRKIYSASQSIKKLDSTELEYHTTLSGKSMRLTIPELGGLFQEWLYQKQHQPTHPPQETRRTRYECSPTGVLSSLMNCQIQPKPEGKAVNI